MAKKIQLSTVRQEADVEVIYVNAALICKVINAHNVMDSIIRKAKDEWHIKESTHTVLDENGQPCLNENGYEIKEPDVDENGKPIVVYNSHKLDDKQLAELAEVVLPFLNELRNTLEGE